MTVNNSAAPPSLSFISEAHDAVAKARKNWEIKVNHIIEQEGHLLHHIKHLEMNVIEIFEKKNIDVSKMKETAKKYWADRISQLNAQGTLFLDQIKRLEMTVIEIFEKTIPEKPIESYIKVKLINKVIDEFDLRAKKILDAHNLINTKSNF